jgi:cytochrome P450
MTIAIAAPVAAPLPDPDLTHLPGPWSPPVVGHTLQCLRDSYGFSLANRARFGDVYRIDLVGRPRVMLHGTEALELVFEDRERIFSSREGWNTVEELFPDCLLTQDFDEHRHHRRIMTAAFKAPVMRNYLAAMAPEMEGLVARLPVGRRFGFHPAVKELLLRLGASLLMGLAPGDARIGPLNRAFIAEVEAAYGIIRKPLPFTKMGRAVRGRAYLTQTFRTLIAERREKPGDDFFSQMCVASDENGRSWSEREIVDHFNFLMAAVYDTTATTLSSMVDGLARHRDWQDRVRAEVTAIDGPIDDDALRSMVLTERVFKEALRLVPPVPFVPRRAMRAFAFQGVRVPAGALVSIDPGLVMRDPALWTDPDRFDPDRFSPERAEDRGHRYAWAPFGGGAHKCLGMHFATMQAKLFIREILRGHRIEAQHSRTRWQMAPIPKPACDLPVRLVPLS